MRGKGYLLVLSVLVGFYISHQFIIWQLVGLIWLLLLIFWSKQKRVSYYQMLILVSVAIFFSIYFTSVDLTVRADLDTETTIEGKVTQITKRTDDYTLFTVADSQSDTQIQVSDFSEGMDSIRIGANCQVRGKIELPDQATNPGQFNYQAYLSNQNIDYQMIVNEQSQLTCSGIHPLGWLDVFRDSQLSFVDHRLSQETATWVKSLVFGDQTAISEELLALFQRWHLTHLLAISGLHISVLVLIIHFSLIYLFRLTKETTYQLLIVFLLVYPFLAGGSPSVWRAAIVTISTYLAWYYRHRVSTLDFLSISFVVLLLIKPDWLYHLGFQFSFLISFSILLSRKILARTQHPLLRSAYLSILSFLVVIPIQVNSFYLFNPLSVIMNMIATFYFSSFLIPLSFFTYLNSLLFSPVMTWLDSLLEWTNSLFFFFLAQLDQFSYYPIVTGQLSPLFIFLYYLSLFYLLAQFEKKNIRQSFYGLLCLSSILFMHQLIPYVNATGKVTVLDVGQADVLVIELPHRRGVILYDVGATLGANFEISSPKAYEQVIKPYLYQAGINKIDAIILSHEDADHIGSLSYLLDDFSVETLITSVYFQWPEQMQAKLNELSIDVEKVAIGQSFQIADQVFSVLSPSRDWADRNDNSLVLYTVFANDAWLLTGDISQHVESDLITHFTNVSIDTLAIAHHGSASSSSAAFLKAISPKTALISVGRNNNFNHPSQQVISRLETEQMTIYRTDHNGAIQFVFDKCRADGTFSPFLP